MNESALKNCPQVKVEIIVPQENEASEDADTEEVMTGPKCKFCLQKGHSFIFCPVYKEIVELSETPLQYEHAMIIWDALAGGIRP